jgi:FSR family fosmidomycin resistance protein-like MFS transporter
MGDHVSSLPSASSSVSALSVGDSGAPARVAGVHPLVARMGVAHFVVDWFSNSLAPLIPLLIAKLQLTLAGAGTLAMIFQLAASVTQVLFGDLADRGRAKQMLWLGALVTVVCLGLVAFCQTWNQLVLVLVVGGLGVAAFHPAGAMLAHRHSMGKPGYAMAVYVTSGTLGFALGPMAIALVADRFGLAWVPLLIVPGLAVVFLALRRLPPLEGARRHHQADRFGFRALRPYAKPLALLYFLVVVRGFVSSALGAFVPVLLARRGASITLAAAGITVYSLAGGLGGFFGGAMADHVGHRRVILMSMLLPVPFLVAAPNGSPYATLACLAVAGFFMLSTLPVNVSFGQLIAPVSAGTVASLMMGFAWGAGALLVPVAGWLADRWGLETTLTALGLVPLAGVALAWPLPRRVE